MTKQTKKTEQTNNLTFSIIAETCDHPKVIYERRDFTLDEAKSALYTLSLAFRKIDIICNETGEVMYNIYQSDEWIERYTLPHIAISIVEGNVKLMREEKR